MKSIGKIFSLAILCLFTLTLFINAPGIPAEDAANGFIQHIPQPRQPGSKTADYPFNFTQVSWDQQIVNEERTHEWNSSRYRYGPSINWHTQNASTSAIIDWNEEIPLNAWVDFIVEVPFSALSGQIPHAVSISGSFFNLSEMEDGNMPEGPPSPIGVFAIYYITEARWEIYSSVEMVMPEGTPDLPENFTLSDIFGPMVAPFAEIDDIGSGYETDYIGEAYRGRFRLLFNSSIIPGFYMFNAMVLDTSYQSIAQSSTEMDPENQQLSGRLLGLNLHQIVNSAFGGYYVISRVDEDGDIIYTVNRGDEFNITMTISNSTLVDNVTLHMSAPSNIKVQKWVYGPYKETQERIGAWQWDDSAKTYIWNASKTVSWAEPRFGYHWEETFTWIDMGKEYVYYHPPPEGDWTEIRYSWPQYVVSYDFTTSSWMYYAGYDYRNQTWTGERWEETKWLEYEPWSTDFPIPFVLNESTSDVYINATNGKLVVVFRGHISEQMLPSGSEYGQTIHIYEQVTNQWGQHLVRYVDLPIASPQEKIDYENQRNLAIDSPVSIVKITHKGEPYSPNWIFQTNIGDTFTVNSRLQGGIDYVDDIDGVAFVMYGHQENWGSDLGIDWWQYSDIQIQAKVGPTGGVEVNVYNYTVRTSWGYGEHYEWREIMIAPGIWQTEYILVEDWFWQELVWDFEAGAWTDQHFPMQSSRARMPVSFLAVGNATHTLIDDDLKISFDVTPLPSMPALEWWWEYFYGNLTWVTDYESGWGSHTVLGWTEDAVYHYWNGTNIVYVEQPYTARVFHNEQTGEVYDRKNIPYVIINSKPEPLKSYIFGDVDYTYETLIREERDYVLEIDRHYIRLFNGTELEVFGDRTAVLYNITFFNGTSFLSYQEYPHYMGSMDYYYMIAADGSLIAMPWPMWNIDIVVQADVVPVTKVDYTLMTYATPVYPFEPTNTVPLYMVGWPEYIDRDHWIMYMNETWEPFDVWRYWEPGMEHLYVYFNHHDGRYYVFDWPWELMKGNYMGSDVYLPHYLTSLFAYVSVEGTNYPIPQVGEPISNWWDLDWIIRDKYSHELAFINGTTYVAKKLLDIFGYPIQDFSPGPPSPYWYDIYQVNVEGTFYNLTDWGMAPWHVKSYDAFPDQRPWVTKANGSLFIPEVVHTDWTIALGHKNPATLDFEVSTWLDVTTGYYDGDYHTSSIQDYNYTYGYEYVMTKLGQEYFYNSTWRAIFHNITLSNGTFFYSAMNHPQIWPNDLSNYETDTFYMIDIYGNYLWWYGWDDFTSSVIMIENVTGDSWSGSFWFQNTSIPILHYNVTHWDWNGNMWISGIHTEDNVWADHFNFIDFKNGTISEIIPLYYTPESYRYNFPSWQFWYDGVWYNISGSSDMIYKAYQFEGYSQKLDYEPMSISIIRSQDRIVTGTPRYGMWDLDLWTTNPENGALDLDGDLDTVDDQYFIKELHSSTDFYNITHEYLDVSILWEPDNETYANEFYLHCFTGMVTFNWTFSWADTYIWTKASTGESLTPEEFNIVRNVLLDEYNNSRAGYWEIAWLARNFTSADQIQKAIDEGWDWAISNSREWSWLWWELDEHYSNEISNGTYSELMDINLAYQYAGMFAWEDEDDDNFMDVSSEHLGDAEMSHYWIPVDADSVSFVTPGEAFGNFNLTDSIYLDVNETVDFGVTFENVTGIVFPFGEFSYWDWYVGQYHGSDFVNFDERPTECMTDELSFAVHFTGIANETGSNIAEVKFDITVGDWDVDTPGGVNVLEGMSLAVSFFSDLSIVAGGGGGGGAVAWYLDDYGQILNNDEATASSNYTIGSGVSSIALMSLGGAPYTWSKNASQVCAVDAQSVPISAVSAIYLSESGGTATTFSVSSEQFYTLIGFKWWDGFAVTVDPVFVGYISHGTSDSEAPNIGSVSHAPVQITGVDHAHIEAAVTDSGGSDVAQVKVHDIDNNLNYSMEFVEAIGRWVVDIPRTQDGRYIFNYQIIASDNAGNTAVSTPRAFPFRDNIAPTITTLSWDNSTDGFGREIGVVSSQVNDTGGSGIDKVILTYSNATGNYNVTMVESAGFFNGTIPNHQPSTTVSFWITVYDIDGNYLESSVNLFTFSSGGLPDTYGPSMSLITHNPASPTQMDTVTVSATVLDPSGIDYVTLQYKIGTGSWINVTMTASGDTWSGIIPTQAVGTTVTYRLVAEDSLNNAAISGEFSYIVGEASVTTTTTTTTTTPGPGPSPEENMMIVILGLCGLVAVLVILVALRRRS